MSSCWEVLGTEIIGDEEHRAERLDTEDGVFYRLTKRIYGKTWRFGQRKVVDYSVSTCIGDHIRRAKNY